MSYDYRYEAEYPVSRARVRGEFIRRTYAHLAGAVLAFVGIEALLLQTVNERSVLQVMLGGRINWMFVLFAFMGAGWIARTWAQSRTSPALQYMGLGLYVIAEAVIFLPLLIYASHLGGPSVIPTAGILTLAVFGGLTVSVFVTGKDFSFLAPILTVCSMIALGVVVAACLFPINLGMFFSAAMVALVSAYILYYTSNVMLHYGNDQYVAAALELFACVATLFWYILQILMQVRNSD